MAKNGWNSGENKIFRLILKKLLLNQKGTIRQNISGIWVTKFTGKLFDDVIAGENDDVITGVQ